jgi:hypothetical protein
VIGGTLPGWSGQVNTPASPSSIIAAALVMQFSVIAIFFMGAVWVGRLEKHEFMRFYQTPSVGRSMWVLLMFAVVTLGSLLFSDQFYQLWNPLSAGVNFGWIRWSRAVFIVFLMDIGCCAILVRLSGGSARSPFTPLYFVLPALGFFLREAPYRVVLYTVVIAVLFVIGLIAPEDSNEQKIDYTGAFAFVSVACLTLSVLMGYLTRPN